MEKLSLKKKLALGALALLVAAGSAAALKRHLDNQPKHAAGECLMKDDAPIAAQIKGLKNDQYQLLLISPLGVQGVQDSVQKVDEALAQGWHRIDCETGEALQ